MAAAFSGCVSGQNRYQEFQKGFDQMMWPLNNNAVHRREETPNHMRRMLNRHDFGENQVLQGMQRSVILRGQADNVSARSRNAYLTVFVSLSLPVILSLFLTLIEGARINAVRMQALVVTNTAADSALAEFHRELLLQYDLLMVDTSYGTNSPAVSNTESHVQNYMEQNFSAAQTLSYGSRDFTGLSVSSVDISDTRFAADNSCTALREQIYAYMSAEDITGTFTEILAKIDTFNGLGLDTSQWSELKSENETELQEALAEEEEEEESEEYSAAAAFVESQGVSVEEAVNLYSGLNQLMSLPLLTQVLGSTSSLSQVSVSTDSLLSHRSIHTGDGAEAENSHGYEEADTITFDFYVFEKCGNYLNQMDKSVLKYQIEYLLNGESSDLENLEATLQTIFLIRLAANLITIMQDSGRQSTAAIWGTIIAILCLHPQLEPLFTTAILIIWVYMESLQDLKTLLNGGSVPLVKSSSDWGTSILSIFTGEVGTSGSDEAGLDYEDYLHILLFLENGDTKNYRLMDLMELDIRDTEGNESFQMDWCMDTFTVTANVSSSFGYSFSVVREASYE